jgi:hypothetical protein
MLALVAASDLSRQKVEAPFEAPSRAAVKVERSRPRRAAVRATSAAALRTLADRLEPAPSA